MPPESPHPRVRPMSDATGTPANRPPLWRPPVGAMPDLAWFGMSTRLGGVSEGPYASLNLGLSVGDVEAAVQENRRRLRLAAGATADQPRMVHQVHGRTIVTPAEASARADGFLVLAGDPWVGVSAADCAAVAVVAEDASAGMLLHCGWRGARAEIGAAGVERLSRRGIPLKSLRAAIGPCLHACCFPVGPEVAEQFDPVLLRAHPSGKSSLDLPAAIRKTLVDAGIPTGNIFTALECTSCDRERYYSHRRDRGITGRHWALLRLGPAP